MSGVTSIGSTITKHFLRRWRCGDEEEEDCLEGVWPEEAWPEGAWPVIEAHSLRRWRCGDEEEDEEAWLLGAWPEEAWLVGAWPEGASPEGAWPAREANRLPTVRGISK